MITIVKKISFTCLIVVILNSIAISQPLSSYLEDSIPMRDGKNLAADVYIPSGCTSCPVILIQTPYLRVLYRWLGLPFGVDDDAALDSQDYIYVTVDWRGFGGSLPAWTLFPNRGEDGYDVVDWIAAQPWCDGNVGTWGPSALGNVQFQTAREKHPNHKCMVPQVAAPQIYYEDYFPGGAARTEYIEQLDGLSFGVSTWVMPHPTHDGLWNLTEPPTWYPDSIEIPTLMIGGWYDHNVINMMEFWNAIRTVSPARDDLRLLMGPWAHGGNGTAHVGTSNQGELLYPAAAGWSDAMAMQFFDYHLQGIANSWDTTNFVTYFQMGEDVWQNDSVWPPQNTLNWDFQLIESSGFLALDPQPDVFGAGSVSVTYDPTDPSPTHGGPTLRMDQSQGPFDISDTVESRSDVLIFDYACAEDMVVKGAPSVHLTVSADVYDTDFTVRLCDVYPDGRSMIISDGIQRMRFRDGTAPGDTSAIVPGQVYGIDIPLPDLAHTFLAGHSIRLDISGSNYPRFNRNMNTGGEMYPGNSYDSLVAPQTSTNTVYTGIMDSYLTLPLVDFSVGIDDPGAPDIQASVYPSPSAGNFTLQVNANTAQTLVVSLFDIEGQLIHKQANTVATGESQFTFDFTDLPNGMYVMRVQNDSGGSVDHKLVITD